LQSLQLGHHPYRKGIEYRGEVAGICLGRIEQRQMAQKLASGIKQRLTIISLPGRQPGLILLRLVDHLETDGPLLVELLTGGARQRIVLLRQPVGGQHFDPICTAQLTHPDRIHLEDMGQLADQGIEEIEPGAGRERLRQLGEQGGLQQRQREIEGGDRTVGGIKRGQPATADLLGGHKLAAPEHMVELPLIIFQMTDELFRQM